MNWQPIETAPEDTDVIVAVNIRGRQVVGEAKQTPEHGWYWAGQDHSDYFAVQIVPTHWMPLPDPPKGAE